MQPSRRNDLVDQSQLQRLVRAQVLAREHQVHRRRHAHQLHGAHGTAETRMNAQHHLRQPQRHLRIVGADAVTASHGEFEPAAEAVAIDGGNGGEGQVREPLQDAVRRADRRHGCSRLAHLAELGHVGACDEATLAGTDDQAGRALLLGLAQALVEFFHRRARERVGAGARFVEGEPGDAIRVDLEGPLA
jgi:hypothetical protein